MVEPYPTTLVEAFRRTASQSPDNLVFVFLRDGEVEADRLTLGDIDRRARAIAARLRTLAAPGETALILYGSGLEAIPAFYGCLYAGVIAVPAIPPRPNQPANAFTELIANAKPKAALTTERMLAQVRDQYGDEPFVQAVTWLTTDGSDQWAVSGEEMEAIADPDP